MKYLFMILLFTFLSGCTLTSLFKEREVQVVKVPVIQPWPQPPLIVRPVLPIDQLKPEDLNPAQYDYIVKLVNASLRQCTGYSEELEKYLNVYKIQPKID